VSFPGATLPDPGMMPVVREEPMPVAGEEPIPAASAWDEALVQTERWLELCASAYVPGPPPNLPCEPLPERLVARADALLGRLHGAESVLVARREELRGRIHVLAAPGSRREVWA
jgi:hypothetical protein